MRYLNHHILVGEDKMSNEITWEKVRRRRTNKIVGSDLETVNATQKIRTKITGITLDHGVVRIEVAGMAVFDEKTQRWSKKYSLAKKKDIVLALRNNPPTVLPDGVTHFTVFLGGVFNIHPDSIWK